MGEPDSAEVSNVCADEIDGTKIRYAPGARNAYWYKHDVIMLDERLKDYPIAHDMILDHELQHAGELSFTEYLELELRTDLNYHFGDGEGIEQVRQYYAECGGSPQPLQERLKRDAARFLRNVWMLFVSPASRLWGQA